MIEKVGHIKNPLSIIAIFAGLAEISGTIVLPFIHESSQNKYVWFLMFFPTFLVGIFFYVLWHKPRVLYAPSDYTDEANFIRMMEPATYSEVLARLENEAQEIISQTQPTTIEGGVDADIGPENGPEAAQSPLQNETERRERAMYRYKQAETTAFAVLATEFPNIKKSVAFNRNGQRTVFDGVFESSGNITIFEIKLALNPTKSFILRQAAAFAGKVRNGIPETDKTMRLILVIVVSDRISRDFDAFPHEMIYDGRAVEVRFIQG
ncbi:hypothetical protein [Rhizobium phaseoli]|uniref:hypothetical protein n=1 Tax=Rhizobium phaseoli TaxID=396 RepID=UPI0007EB194B|nr:hypothetical protein [Rhizobium phaseoli]